MSYIALATLTLTGNDANVTFANIPGIYRDLVCVIAGTPSATQDISINVVNGSGQNISVVNMGGSGSVADSITASLGNLTASATGISPQSGDRYTMIIHFMDYAQTDKHKTILSRYSNGSRGVNAAASRWASTSAITSFNLEGFFATGTTLSLYGIAG